MKYFFLIQWTLFFLLPAQAATEVMMTDIMRESDYQKHKRQAAIVHEFAADIRLLVSGENIINGRTPNAQADTLKLVELWETDIERFCSGPIQRFINMQDQVDANNSDALESMTVFEEDFKLRDIGNTCQRIKTELHTLLEDTFQIQREVPRSLASYRETVDRAVQSKVFLSKAIADTSSSIFTTQISNKAKLDTLIRIHEIRLNNNESKQWRSQLNAIDKKQTQLLETHATDIAEKFQKPTDIFESGNGEPLKKRILELLDTEKEVEIILRDNDIRTQKRLITITRGMEYESISFYAYYPGKKETRLDYGWYEKNLDNNNDAIHFSQRLIFPATQTAATKTTQTSATVTPEKNDQTDTNQHVASANAHASELMADQVSNKKVGRFSRLIWWLLGLLQAVLMLAVGLLVTHKHHTDLIPAKITDSIEPVATKISSLKSPLALALLAIAVLALISSLPSLNLIGIGAAVVAICCAFLCIDTAPVPTFMKPLKPFAQWFGLATLALGLLVLVRLFL
ncbi:hypothetical protein [Marinicella sp. W31]|uniref:hypothetical protein n=1 Tax=Marinicella sp. W31 TaxID=3023713 RepID=UPI003757B3E1